jgi:TonB family protein
MFFRSVRLPSVFLLAALAAFPALAQEAANQNSSQTETAEDISARPIFVTTRIFQMKAKAGGYNDISGQVFKMNTASLASHEKWAGAFAKTYPGLEASLLRTETKKVFRTSKPATLSLVKQPDGRAIELQMFGAQSPGDGTTPGTTLVPEVSLHFGNDRVKKPITFVIQPMEVESGTTYFFTAASMKFTAADYTHFVRPNAPAEFFAGQDLFLIFAFSVDLDKTTQPARYYDERQSYDLQEKAVKKPLPEVPVPLREAGLGGAVRVQIEIAPSGKVSAAHIYSSNFPEMNHEAMAAARQWEFPAELFARDKNPITGFLTFTFSAQAPSKKPSTGNSSANSPTQ